MKARTISCSSALFEAVALEMEAVIAYMSIAISATLFKDNCSFITCLFVNTRILQLQHSRVYLLAMPHQKFFDNVSEFTDVSFDNLSTTSGLLFIVYELRRADEPLPILASC